MIHVRKMVIAGIGVVALAGALVSFTNGNGDEKMKRYQVIHHANGEMLEFDTLIPMNSSYTVEQFLADKGISNENVEIINMKDGAHGNAIFIGDHGADEHVIIREMHDDIRIEMDGEEGKEVQIKCEIGEDGEMKVQKFVDGEEVEMTEEEMEKLKIHSDSRGEHHKTIKMEIHGDEDHHGDMEWISKEENVKVICEVGEDGEMKVKKFVNGEEVEVTEEELEEMHKMHGEDGRIMIKIDGDEAINMEEFVRELHMEMEELDIDMDELQKEIEIEIEKVMEEIETIEGEEGEHKVIIKKRIHDGNEEGVQEEVIILDGEEMEGLHDMHMRMMTSGDHEEFTVVIVTENIDPKQLSKEVKIRKKVSTSDLSIYPNPSKGIINLQMNQSDKVKTNITVTDVNGKVVFKEKLGKFSGEYTKEIDLSKNGPGTYLINIERGEQTTAERVVIE